MGISQIQIQIPTLGILAQIVFEFLWQSHLLKLRSSNKNGSGNWVDLGPPYPCFGQNSQMFSSVIIIYGLVEI